MDQIKNNLKSPNLPCDFIKVTQGQPINALMRARKQEYDAPAVDFYTQDRSFGCGSNRDILVKLPPGHKFSESPKKTLGFLLYEFQESQSQDIDFTLKEYREFCKLSNSTKARTKIQKDLELLSQAALIWEGSIPNVNPKTGKRSKPSDPTRYSVEIIKSGSCVFPQSPSEALYQISFSDEFYKMLNAWGFMYVPASLFQFSLKRYPYLFALGWSLCAHLNMNKKGTECGCLTLESLLDCAGIPTYQEEKSNQRHYKDQIMDPVITTLLELRNSCGLAYHYAHKNGTPLSKEEEDQILSLDYPIQDFIKLKIYFSFPNMPQHEQSKKSGVANKKKKSTHSKKQNNNKEGRENPLFFSALYNCYFFKNLTP